MEYAIVWIICGVVSAFLANKKGRSVLGWFIIGFLLGPIGLIIVFLIGGKSCDYCKKSIHKDAVICPFCQQKVTPKPKVQSKILHPAMIGVITVVTIIGFMILMVVVTVIF